MSRILATSATSLTLTHEPLPDEDVVDGLPTAAVHPLAEVGDVEVGVWEMSAGTATDTEVDEVFVVLAGRGEVAFDDGETVPLAPGVVVRLAAGERTTWRVDEPLRKVYVALG